MQNSTKMWKILRTSENFLMRKKHVIKCKRLFLSEAYRCQENWDKRLENSLLKKVQPFDFYLELEHKYSNAGKISAVDVDIFVNSLKEAGSTEDLLDMIYKLRLTPETSFTLPSTHYAVIRYLLDQENPDQVYEVLNDRLNYGIFPDHHSFNLLMDTYITKGDFMSAAKIATLLMLQEDSDHPIANSLALYSCHKFLENPETWKIPDLEEEESKEEIKVRVRYLRNKYFDDHFDLVQPSDLVGKTLAFFGKHRGETLGRSCQLRGLILYKKYPKVIQLLDDWKDLKEVVYQEVLELIKKDSPKLFEGELTEDLINLKGKLEDLEKRDLKAGNMEEEMEIDIKKAIAERTEQDIVEQCKAFDEWTDLRMNVLNKHLEEEERLKRIRQIEKMKRQIESKERLLTFFDKEEEIELKIESILEERKKYEIDPKLLKKKLKLEENYIPPEVTKRKTSA